MDLARRPQGVGGPGRGPGLTTALALALLAGIPSLFVGASTAQAAEASPGMVKLSNERTLTRWAHPVHKVAPIRARPSAQGRRIGRTHRLTEDGFSEVYVALRMLTNRRGQTWIKIRIPTRDGIRKGWVRASALGPLSSVRTQLVIKQSRKRAVLYKEGHRIWSAPIGVGASRTPTPSGNFWVREKFKTRGSGGIYGPFAFGTSAYSVLSDWPRGGVVGIHGTDQPGLIPGRPSHGCIRVRNHEIRELSRLMPIGTPVRIR